MRDPERINLMIEKLRVLWHAYPDMRLGQLVENLAQDTEPFYVEDDVVHARIDAVCVGGFAAIFPRRAT